MTSATSITTIAPREAASLAESAEVLFVDIREPEEFRSSRMPGAVLRPLSVLDALPPEDDPSIAMVFFCHSGRRTSANADLIRKRGYGPMYILDGGLVAWKEAGLPVIEEHGPPCIMRQVRIAAGGLILITLALAQAAPAFYWLTALVGAGLVVSGITGFCGMAKLLMRMPWNRKRG